VLAVLGVADEQLLADAFDAVQGADARDALMAVARCVESGRDAGSFTRDLEGRARELLVVQTLGEVPPELSLTPEIDERLRAQAQRIGPAAVVRVLDLLGAALEGVRAGADPRTQLELALVKAATPQTDGSTRALLARIERLERALAGGVAPPATVPSDGVTPPPPPSAPMAVAPAAAQPPTSSSPSPPPIDAPPSEPASPSPPATPEEHIESSTHTRARGGSTPALDVPDAPTPASPEEEPAPLPPASAPGMPEEEEEEEELAGVQVAVESLPGEALDGLWPAVLESVRADHGLLGAVFDEAVPAILTEEELTLAFASTAAFLKRKAEDPDNRAMLIDTLRRLSGRRYRVSFELREDLPAQEGLGAGPPTEEEIMARLVEELDAEELPEDWLQQRKGGD
jgi:DNA polymerase-3 subunit gamma/tau